MDMPGLGRSFRKLLRVPNDLQLYDAVRAGRVGPDFAITCRGKTDGAGAQAHACITAMAFAKAAGITYLHTPFQKIEHAEGDPALWTTRWESFFNLGNGETIIALDHEAIDLKLFLDQPRLWRREKRIVQAQHFQGVLARYPEFYDAILPRLRQKYHATDKSGFALDRAGEDIVVGVHIRRGDVSGSDPAMADRFTDDARIIATLLDVQNAVKATGRTIRINIYSEGRPEDFARFSDMGCELQIGKDAFATVHNLVESDVLVTAKSAFSFVAGLLSTGVKLYEPFQATSPGDWIVRRADGGFDKETFAARLAGR
jgi:hypothetical protein